MITAEAQVALSWEMLGMLGKEALMVANLVVLPLHDWEQIQ